MTTALEQLTIFKETLEAVTEFKDSLPQVTVLIIAHTDKKGNDLFGSVTQFANCDVLYMLKRQEHAFEATLSCIGARDIEEPPDLTVTLEKVTIETANGPEQNLAVISGAVAPVKKSSKKDDDLTTMENVLEVPLGNKATRTQWMESMQNYGRGWSEASFDKKLGLLKKQGRVTGGSGQGEYYSVVRAGGRGAKLYKRGFRNIDRNVPRAKPPSLSSPLRGMRVVSVVFMPKKNPQTALMRE